MTNFDQQNFSSMKMPNFQPPKYDLSGWQKMVAETESRKKLNDQANRSQIRSELLLEQIEKNTASLTELTKLLHESNLQHDQIIDLMGDLFAIAKAKDGQEAQSLYQKSIGKISSFGEDVGNITTLVTFATGIYNAVVSLL